MQVRKPPPLQPRRRKSQRLHLEVEISNLKNWPEGIFGFTIVDPY